MFRLRDSKVNLHLPLLMEEIGEKTTWNVERPCKCWRKLSINWCRCFSINSSTCVWYQFKMIQPQDIWVIILSWTFCRRAYPTLGCLLSFSKDSPGKLLAPPGKSMVGRFGLAYLYLDTGSLLIFYREIQHRFITMRLCLDIFGLFFERGCPMLARTLSTFQGYPPLKFSR